MGPRSSRRFAFLLTTIALVAFVVRLTYLLGVERGDELSGDAFYYHRAATLLADGKGFIDPYRYEYGGAQELLIFGDAVEESAATALLPGHEEPTAGHPPAWTVTLAFFSVLGLRSVLAHQVIGVLVGTLGVVLIGLAAREVARGVRVRSDGSDEHRAEGANEHGAEGADEHRAEIVGLVAAGIAAVYAFLFINDGLLMSETLVVVVVAACIIAAIRFWRAPTVGNAALFGVLGGIAPLTRAELLPYLPIVAALALWQAPLPWRTKLLRYATCGVIALAVVTPWVVRNLRAFDEPVFLSNGFGTVLVQTNCDATYGGEKLGYWELFCGLPQPLGPSGEPLDESARDVVLRERAFDYIGEHKQRFVTVALPARLGRMFAVYDPVQTIRFDILAEGRNFRISALGLAQYYVLAALAVAGGWSLRRRGQPLAPLLTWFGLVAVTALMAFGNSRYRVSAEPALVVLAALGVVAIVQRRRPVPPGDPPPP
jgi:hypothetical protein